MTGKSPDFDTWHKTMSWHWIIPSDKILITRLKIMMKSTILYIELC